MSLAAFGRTKAAAIWYKALTEYMTSGTDYSGAREATVQAAGSLYGSAGVNAVNAAWDAVGVPAAPAPRLR